MRERIRLRGCECQCENAPTAAEASFCSRRPPVRWWRAVIAMTRPQVNTRKRATQRYRTWVTSSEESGPIGDAPAKQGNGDRSERLCDPSVRQSLVLLVPEDQYNRRLRWPPPAHRHVHRFLSATDILCPIVSDVSPRSSRQRQPQDATNDQYDSVLIAHVFFDRNQIRPRRGREQESTGRTRPRQNLGDEAAA
jgi:hypothetical protein